MTALNCRAGSLGVWVCAAAACLAGAGPAGVRNPDLEGAALASELRLNWPSENFVQTGWLKMRDSRGGRTAARIRCTVVVTPTNWVSIFQVTGTNSHCAVSTEELRVIHRADCPSEFFWTRTVTDVGSDTGGLIHEQHSWAGARWQCAFGGSDFWAVDLGLEFLCWPGQRLLKREMRRSRPCRVLESTNPVRCADGYSRVVTWIDSETGGIVRGEAYDANNKLFKEFEPKEFRKVKGRWELQQMRIRNLKTGSQTVIEFDPVPQ